LRFVADRLGEIVIELYQIADLSRGRLAVALRPRGGDWLSDELGAFQRLGWSVLVTTLEHEELRELELESLGVACSDAGIEWIHFPIPDRGLPSVSAVLPLTETLQQHLTRSRCCGSLPAGDRSFFIDGRVDVGGRRRDRGCCVGLRRTRTRPIRAGHEGTTRLALCFQFEDRIARSYRVISRSDSARQVGQIELR
jgi:hypothetical protein